MQDNFPTCPTSFVKFVRKNIKLKNESAVIKKLSSERAPVNAAIKSKKPVYGLTTGLGGNLAHDLNEGDIQEFQEQLIRGRAVAVGESFSEEICRGVLLARILSAREGQSGISVEAYKYLIQFWNKGFSSTIPKIGSIGAGDLTQNAHFGLSLIGLNEIWLNGRKVATEELKRKEAFEPIKLKPKDGLALINHKGVTISLAAFALQKVKQLYKAQEIAIASSLEAYQANVSIFSPSVNLGHEESGQTKAAAGITKRLSGSIISESKIQDALSFRTISPVLGVLNKAIERAEILWKEDLFSSGDNPAVIDGRLISTPNFHSIALSLQLEAICLSISSVASASVQRTQKLMDDRLSGLPKYLSPIGGPSAGMVPVQKTAAALLSRVKHAAIPLAFDPPSVSETVEDVAPMTSEVAKKLSKQLDDFRLIIAIEAMVAAQAIELRGKIKTSYSTKLFLSNLRLIVPKLYQDRPLGGEIEKTALVLDQLSQS
jgi:histidine ammonia-lyase